MYNRAFDSFSQNISRVKDIATIYTTIHDTRIRLHINLDDLLRMQIVYVVGALDKLIHDLIKVGLRHTYFHNSLQTNAFLKDTVLFRDVFEIIQILKTSNDVVSQEIEIARYLDDIINKKLSYLSFQAKDKILDGLAYIWQPAIINSQGRSIGLNKWKLIVQEMSNLEVSYQTRNEQDIERELSLIVSKRNSIAHEADMDMNHTIRPILYDEVQNSVRFIEVLGTAIFNLIQSSGTHLGRTP